MKKFIKNLFADMQKVTVAILCMICTIFCFSCKSSMSEVDEYPYYYGEHKDIHARQSVNDTSLYLCTDELCLYYQQLWRELFIELNDLSDDYFDHHIEVYETCLKLWGNQITNEGSTRFEIYYKINVDWAIAYNFDWIQVKNNKGAPEINIYPGTYLTKEEIKTYACVWKIYSHFGGGDFGGFYNRQPLPACENLKFDSYKSAMNYLQIKANANHALKFEYIEVNQLTGAWMLHTLTQYDDDKCMFATLNLNTGEAIIEKMSCSEN